MHGERRRRMGSRLLHRKHTRTTCLSSERHNDIKDHLSHYMGCLEYSERDHFFKENEIWQSEERYLIEDHGRSQKDAQERCREKRRKWKENCDKEISRVKKLRNVLSKDESEKHLVDCIQMSAKAWRSSPIYKEHIELVMQWRETELREMENDPKSQRPRRLTIQRSQPEIVFDHASEESSLPRRRSAGSVESPISPMPEGPYNPEAFVRPILARTPSAALSTMSLFSTTSALNSPIAEEKEEYDPERDINVHMLQFQSGESREIEDPGVRGKFPDQKVKVLRILNGDQHLKASLLHKERFTGKITYFHFPANNMEWAEKAIARYFGQKRPEFHALERELRKQITETALILRESHWRGQLHGERTSPNSLFMRPLCEAISSDPKNASQGPNNIILFMPYLHWETTRQRQRFAEEIDAIISYQTETAMSKESKDREDRKRERKRLTDFINSKKPALSPLDSSHKSNEAKTGEGCIPRFLRYRANTEPEKSESQEETSLPKPKTRKTRKIRTMPELLERVQRSKDSLQVDDNGRPESRSALGQYLLDAARLFEGMSNYRDKKLLEKYLDHDPPIHPRRTLDQAYYWSMNTRAKDTDQVVYRATTPKPGSFEHFDPDKRYDSQKHWRGHPIPKGGIEGHECKTCRDHIRMLSRVIMVDQLWMWILDEQTIITCFPKRYGSNKNDRSGVHKSIRVRFEGERGGQVKSVFDMALIIFDECSNSLFDRTKVTDNQPEVIESFSEAIGNVMHKQTVAFGKLWRWAERARQDIFLASSSGNAKFNIPLLDINPEGDMEREIKDIIEEIGIMLYIQKTHRDILKQFKTKADAILAARVLSNKSMQESSHEYSSQAREETNEEINKASEAHKWFLKNAEELTTKVDDRIEQLEELKQNAERTAQSVKDLLELKQQQASVVQAWQSVKQSEEAVTQGRSIVVFTVFTIIFLPLSFMTSIFGMNTFGLEANKLPLATTLKYIFTISIGVVFVAIFFSLNNSLNSWMRMALWCGWNQLVTPLWMRLGIYEAYLHLDIGAPRMYQETSRHLDELKRGAHTNFLRRVKKWGERKVELEKMGKTPTWWRIWMFRFLFAAKTKTKSDNDAAAAASGSGAATTTDEAVANLKEGEEKPGHYGAAAVGDNRNRNSAGGVEIISRLTTLQAGIRTGASRVRLSSVINGRTYDGGRREVDEESGLGKVDA